MRSAGEVPFECYTNAVGDLARCLRAAGEPEWLIADKIMQAVAEGLEQKPDEGFEATGVRVDKPEGWPGVER